jgi:type IV pilus assembly protein PilC
MNRRFASALVYPTVIAVAALALLNFGWLSIVPKFHELFGDLGITDFSTVSRIAFFIGGWLMPITMLVLVGAAVLVVLIFAQRRAASGRLWLDAWKLRLPVVGQIIEKASLARFSGTLGLLLSAGIDLPRAVRLAAEGTGNRTVERLLQGVSAQIERGHSLSEAIGDSGAMPASMAWRVGVAEESGMLPESLVRMSGLYAAQVDSLVTSLAGLLEPVLIVVIGSGIAILVLGMFLPLVSVIQSLCSYSG